MAKNPNTEAAIVPPKVENAKGGGRAVYITVPTEDGGTREMKRSDYIRARWEAKASRGQIAAELTQLEGKEVTYQVVFQATKGLPGGPDKVKKAEESAEE